MTLCLGSPMLALKRCGLYEVEVCAGKGNVTRALRDAGYKGKAFDVALSINDCT